MTLGIKHIQFADEVPMNRYFESAPFSELVGPTHLVFALTVVDDGRTIGLDFWGDAVLNTDGRPAVDIDGATGRITVATLDQGEITKAVSDYVAGFDSSVMLRFDGDLIFEDGE